MGLEEQPREDHLTLFGIPRRGCNRGEECVDNIVQRVAVVQHLLVIMLGLTLTETTTNELKTEIAQEIVQVFQQLGVGELQQLEQLCGSDVASSEEERRGVVHRVCMCVRGGR